MELLTAALNKSNGFLSLAPGFDENQIFYNSEVSYTLLHSDNLTFGRSKNKTL